MNKVKIMLATIAGISAVGGAFALKSKKEAGSIKLYGGTTTVINNRIYAVCDQLTAGTILPAPQVGSFYGYYAPTAVTKVCTLGYYTLNP